MTEINQKVQEELQKMKLIVDDFELYVKNNLKIKDMDAEIVQLEFKPIQRKIIAMVLDDLQNNRQIRYIILKARKEGVSTLIEAFIYWWNATHKNIESKIVAHDRETATTIYEMFQRYYDNSNPLFKPKAKYSTKSELVFDTEEGDGLKSKITIASAANVGTGRGQTINWLHCSEVAKWTDGDELMAGLIQAVPKRPKTAIFLESTANGIGDYFHRTWQAAKAGTSVFKPLFFSWADDPTYVLPVPKGFKLTPEEQKIKADHNLSMEQMAWRREATKEFVSDPAKFYQEYPLTDIEAFLASGSSRFNIPALVKMEEECREAKTYDLVEKNPKSDGKMLFTRMQKVISPIEVPGAPLKIWEFPKDGREYVIGADVAEGIGGDFSVATILDKDNMETVARWRGDCEPSDFGEILEQLGRYYNNALIACEINNHGLTTVQRIRDLSYSNLYRRESGIDERFETHTSKLGWKTDRKTKPLMINALSEAINLGKIKDYDKIFVRECMEYVVDDRGLTNAQIGAHDDTVISTAIALQVFDWVDVVVNNRTIPSYIPPKYVEMHKKMQKIAKKR